MDVILAQTQAGPTTGPTSTQGQGGGSTLCENYQAALSVVISTYIHAHAYTYIHTCTHIYIYIYIHIYVCMCVCVCVCVYYIHTYIHTYTHTFIYYIHTYISFNSRSNNSVISINLFSLKSYYLGQSFIHGFICICSLSLLQPMIELNKTE